MTEVTCAVCGMGFDEEGATDLGAIMIERKGKRIWFCSPPCEREFSADPTAFGG